MHCQRVPSHRRRKSIAAAIIAAILMTYHAIIAESLMLLTLDFTIEHTDRQNGVGGIHMSAKWSAEDQFKIVLAMFHDAVGAVAGVMMAICLICVRGARRIFRCDMDDRDDSFVTFTTTRCTFYRKSRVASFAEIPARNDFPHDRAKADSASLPALFLRILARSSVPATVGAAASI